MSVVIVDAKRTPIGNFKGIYTHTPATDLGAHVIEAVNTPNIPVDEVIMGCVLSAGLGQAPTRQAALKAGLPKNTPCVTLNKVCGSGLKAVALAYDSILSGSKSTIIAGGMENMTRAPTLMREIDEHISSHMMVDGLNDAYREGTAMGVLTEELASQKSYTREHQDQFAIESGKRAIEATKAGYFKQEILPFKGINDDEPLKKINFEKIPTLKTPFKENGTVTAANASGVCDGAAALLLTKEETPGVKSLARIVGYAEHSQEPDTFNTAPIGAIETLLQKINWSINDVDLFEINEAFAVTTLSAIDHFSLHPQHVNIHGGACALGHPIGASGTRILTTLIHSLHIHNKNKGIAAICIGGGEAVAMAVEKTS